MALFTKRFIYGIVITSFLLSLAGCIGSSSRAIPITAKNSQLVRHGKYDEAIANLSKAAKDYPDKGYVWYWLAEAYKGKREYRSAIPCYEKALALELSPGQKKSANDGLGWCYFWTGRFDKAVNFFTKTLKLDPMWKRAYLGRGLSNKQMGRYEESIKDFTQFLRAAPNHKLAIANRAWSYLFLQQYEEGLKDFNQVEVLESAGDKFWLPSALTGQGWCNYYLGNFKVALAKFDQALNIIAPTDNNLRRLAYRGKAFTQAALGNHSGSFRSIEQARAAQDYDTSFDLALLHYVAGNKKAAWKLMGGAGYLGVTLKPRTGSQGPGIVVVGVSAGGPAQKAGILPGDTITNVGGRPISNMQAFVRSVKGARPGSKLLLTVLRGNTSSTIPVVIGQADDLIKNNPLVTPIFKYGKTTPAPKPAAPLKPSTRTAHIPKSKAHVAHIPKQPRLPAPHRAVKTRSHVARIPTPPRTTSTVSDGAKPGPRDVNHASVQPAVRSLGMIHIDQVKAVPKQVPAGDAFDIVVDFTIKDPGAGDRELPVVIERTIYKQGEIIHRFKPVEKTAPNGKPWRLIFSMMAANQKGRYTMGVVIKYNNKKIKRSATFVIK